MRGPHHRLLTDVAGDREETKRVDLASEMPLGTERKEKEGEGMRIREKDRKRRDSMYDEERKTIKNREEGEDRDKKTRRIT